MSKITERIAAEMGCAYIYDDWGRINLKADKYGNHKQTRLIIETLPTNGQIDTRFAPLVRASRTCIVAFLKPCALDYNVVLDFLDANMAGVRVTLTLKELEGECV